jgi:thiamine kinase-like enzyme
MTIIDFDGVCFNSRAMDIATLFLGHADRIPSAI